MNTAFTYAKPRSQATSFVPTSPLIRLLESMTADERLACENIRLSSDLGYRSNACFMNAQHLLYWLKPQKRMSVGADWAANRVKIHWFSKKLTKSDLFSHCDARSIAA